MTTQIHIRPATGTWIIRAGGALIGQSDRALELTEGSYPTVVYFPRDDVTMGLLHRTQQASTCPHKGQASYYSITTPEGMVVNAAWSYEAPKSQMGAIAGHLAFYPDRVLLEQR